MTYRVYIDIKKIPVKYCERQEGILHIGSRYIPWSEPEVLVNAIINKGYFIKEKIYKYFNVLQSSIGKKVLFTKNNEEYILPFDLDFIVKNGKV